MKNNLYKKKLFKICYLSFVYVVVRYMIEKIQKNVEG